MSQPRKKVVVSTKKVSPTVSKSKRAAITTDPGENLLYGRKNYIYALVGIGLIFLGMILMMGGHMPNDVWDDSVIYSKRRTLLAPIIILIGLGLQFFAIFKNRD